MTAKWKRHTRTGNGDADLRATPSAVSGEASRGAGDEDFRAAIYHQRRRPRPRNTVAAAFSKFTRQPRADSSTRGRQYMPASLASSSSRQA